MGLQIPQGGASQPKRQRYSHEDDILLAKFWATDPKGTSDKLFQEFARIVSYHLHEYATFIDEAFQHAHHPWKGWQEHHRIHKSHIDHMMQLHLNGVDLATLPVPPQPRAGRPPAAKRQAEEAEE